MGEMNARRSSFARAGRSWSAALLVVAVVAAIVSALAVPGVHADDAATTPPEKAAPARLSGMSPMPNDAEVPIELMPPGSRESPVPSDEIFPPQSITIRFNHKKHVKDLKLSCKSCHTAAYGSLQSSDSLLPRPAETCDSCHDTSHADLANVTAGKEDNGQCSYCHIGATRGAGGRVAPLVIPAPNLRFSHKKHLDRNINCQQCHGRVEELELATRDQLPRMAGCFTCHDMPKASRGDASSECTTCHLTELSGKLVQDFATGELLPPDWLRMAGHTPDWIERHKTVAANDSSFCASCHQEEDCSDCHDGKLRDRRVHPNDWITMHASAARLDNPRCTSCHQETSFCGDCHRRTGVARDGPTGNRPAGARFHPPPETWVYPPRSTGHHAWEAERNLNTCVSCHAERDCATCHATRGVAGGAGISPHPSGFASKCSIAWSRNPRPCLVCHTSSDGVLAGCK
ncbi:MAG: cytochrome c family protein [Polyangiaceae bacterium]|nr:cytochrome c family protein [Polyangiaceae bacterium]